MARIFISYSRADTKAVDPIIRQLEKAGHPVWVDRGSIHGGEQWRMKIVEAVESSDAIILVLSENSISSDNVRKEMDLAEVSKKWVIPLDLQPVKIPSSMAYQLAGIQRIDMHSDFGEGFQQLLETLDLRKIDRPLPQPVPVLAHVPRWIAILGIVIALGILMAIVVLKQLTSSPATAQIPAETSAPVAALFPTSQLTTQPIPTNQPASQPIATSQPSLQPIATNPPTQSSVAVVTPIPPDLPLPQLEHLLTDANLGLSSTRTREGLAAMRSYFTGPDSAYQMLAIASLKVVGEKRLKKMVYLDMIDDFYTSLVGGEDNYLNKDGELDVQHLQEAIVKAYIEYYGEYVPSLDQILEPRE